MCDLNINTQLTLLCFIIPFPYKTAIDCGTFSLRSKPYESKSPGHEILIYLVAAFMKGQTLQLGFLKKMQVILIRDW